MVLSSILWVSSYNLSFLSHLCPPWACVLDEVNKDKFDGGEGSQHGLHGSPKFHEVSQSIHSLIHSFTHPSAPGKVLDAEVATLHKANGTCLHELFTPAVATSRAQIWGTGLSGTQPTSRKPTHTGKPHMSFAGS